MMEKSYAETLSQLDSLISQTENADALQQRGILKFTNEDDFQGVLNDLTQANKLVENNAITLKYLGAVKRVLDDYSSALYDLNKANSLQPNDAFTLANRGATKRLLVKYKEALQDLLNANELQPNDAFTIKNIGVTKRLLGDHQAAIDYLNKANELQPNNAFTLKHRGVSKIACGHYKSALEDLNKADQLNPNNLFTIKHRAVAKYRVGDYSGALEDVERYLQTNPSNHKFIDWKRKIKSKLTSARALPPSTEGKSCNSIVATNDIPSGIIQFPYSELVVCKVLGEGGFGEVLLAEWRGIKVALKKLKANVAVDNVSHEANALMRLRYKFIVTMMGITTDPVTKSTILIMEYMKHGSLEDLLFKHNVKLTRSEVIRLALDIAQGVNYLHSQNPKVLHRDLKSANVLSTRRAKISDFGTAIFLLPNVRAKTVIGAIGIAMPPEMVAEEPYNEKIDVFAFGVVMYEMLSNKRLPALDEIHRQRRIGEAIDDVKLRQLVLDCCMTDPNARFKQYRAS